MKQKLTNTVTSNFTCPAGKYIDQLIAVGLIRRTMKTGFTMRKRLASTYALTHLPQGNKAATNDWKHFKSESQ